MRTTSPNGIALLKELEGLRLEIYQDLAGYWTIGYGHRMPHTKLNASVITEEEADQQLAIDLQDFEANLFSLLPNLGQNEFDALICLSFNIGIAAFDNSGVLRFLKAGDFETALDRWADWDHVKGVVSPGLANRRRREMELFQKPDLPTSPW